MLRLQAFLIFCLFSRNIFFFLSFLFNLFFSLPFFNSSHSSIGTIRFQFQKYHKHFKYTFPLIVHAVIVLVYKWSAIQGTEINRLIKYFPSAWSGMPDFQQNIWNLTLQSPVSFTKLTLSFVLYYLQHPNSKKQILYQNLNQL